MSKTKTVRVTAEELELLKKLREGAGLPEESEAVDPALEAQKALADAFVDAINRTKPAEKKTVLTRKKKTPWTPTDGKPEIKLKRRMYHHGIELTGRLTNEERELLNKLKSGVYCEGWVQVQLRKDRGLNIEYPVKTNSQRLRLINKFGIRSFSELLRRIIDEKENPATYRKLDDAGLYDIE